MTSNPTTAAAGLLRATGIDGGRTPGDATIGGVPMLVVAIGWATVELDRTEDVLRSAGGWRVEPAEPDTLLGATARIGRSAAAAPLAVLLEPFTEGRLAAFLVRHGEAPAALYLAPRDGGLAEALEAVAAAGTRTIEGPGPLGPSALVLGRRADEPQLLLVAVPSGP